MSQPKEGARVGEVGVVTGDPEDVADGEEYFTNTLYSDEIAHWDVEAKWYLFVR